MKFKNTIFLLLLLIALVVVALIIENPFSKKAEKLKEAEITSLFPNFKIEDAAKVEIKQLGSEFVMEKKAGKWVVTSDKDFPADQESLEKLLESVRDFKTKDIVSKNKEKQAQFQVNEMMGIGAKISDSKNKVLAHIYVGKNGPNFLSTYIRKEGSDDVILAEGYLKSIFDRSRSAWKDMNIFKFDAKLCQQIYLESPDGKITCEKDDKGTWNVKEPEAFPADQPTVDKIIETLSTLQTNDYPEKKALSEYNLDKPERILKFKLTDKTEHTLLVSKEDKNKFYAKKPDSDLIYSLYKYRIDSIFKKLDDFRKKAPEEGQTEAKPPMPGNINPVKIATPEKSAAIAISPEKKATAEKAAKSTEMSTEQKKEAEKAFLEAMKKQQEASNSKGK